MSKQDLQNKISEAVQEFTHKERVDKISLFGSFLYNSTQARDIDLLIELSQPVSYFELARMERKLQEKLNLKVDLVEPAALSRYFRDEVLKAAKPIYER
jgi:predicted nucleotidyltransferase